jgi:hypothetical protein
MAPTLTATRGTVFGDTLEQDNADVLSSRLNDIGDPSMWTTTEEHFNYIENHIANLKKEKPYLWN